MKFSGKMKDNLEGMILEESQKTTITSEESQRLVEMFDHEIRNELTSLLFVAFMLDKTHPNSRYGKKVRGISDEIDETRNLLMNDTANKTDLIARIQQEIFSLSSLASKMIEDPNINGYGIKTQGIYERVSSMTLLLHLQGLDKESLIKNQERLDLVELSRHYADGWKDHLRQHNLVLRMGYTPEENRGIYGYFDRSVISVVLSTILGNCVNYALDGSEIRLGIRQLKVGDLEIIMENKTDGRTKRKVHGLGRGKGFPFIRRVIGNLGGSISTHNHLKERNYSHFETYGPEQPSTSKNVEGIFGVKIILPKE